LRRIRVGNKSGGTDGRFFIIKKKEHAGGKRGKFVCKYRSSRRMRDGNSFGHELEDHAVQLEKKRKGIPSGGEATGKPRTNRS